MSSIARPRVTAGLLRALLLLAGVPVLMLVLPPVARADRLEGRVERVTDGDSLWVRVSAAAGEARGPDGDAVVLKVRVQGIDAPERCQRHGAQAGQALRDRALGQAVMLDRSGQDAYDRSLARVWLDGQDLGAWMVSEGHAWSYARNSSPERPGGRYAREQRAAQSAGRGLFADPRPVAPWVFRRLNGPCAAGG